MTSQLNLIPPQSAPATCSTELPCITLWRPWALWVRVNRKTIETRTHSRFQGLNGKRIAIHAGLKWDYAALESVRPRGWLTEDQVNQTLDWKRSDFGAGKVVALATVDGVGWLSSQPIHEDKALIECQTPRFGLYLTDITPIDGPLVKGGQGIFRVRLSLPSNSELNEPSSQKRTQRTRELSP